MNESKNHPYTQACFSVKPLLTRPKTITLHDSNCFLPAAEQAGQGVLFFFFNKFLICGDRAGKSIEYYSWIFTSRILTSWILTSWILTSLILASQILTSRILTTDEFGLVADGLFEYF